MRNTHTSLLYHVFEDVNLITSGNPSIYINNTLDIDAVSVFPADLPHTILQFDISNKKGYGLLYDIS